MLSGLMTATIFASVAPAYAQSNDNDRGNRGDRGAQQRSGEARQQRGEGFGRMQGERRAERRVQQAQRAPGEQRQVQAQAAPAQRQWQQRPQAPVVSPQVNRPDRRDRRDDRQDVRQDRRIEQRADRQDWRQGQRNDRQDVRQDRRQIQRVDRRDDRRDYRNDNNGRRDNNWSNGRRYDDRTRWANQRRWDNGWRQDRRYDWQSYRSRYGDRYRAGRYYAPRGWDYGYRRFSIGIVLSQLLYSNNYWLDDPYSYRLPPAYGSLRWVRYYDDAMLVDTRDGYVVDVIHDFFW